MRNKIRIGFDMDDVVFKFMESLVKLNNETFNDNLKTEDVRDWDLSKYSKGGAKIYELFKTPGLYDNLELNDGMYEIIKTLYDSKIYEPVLVSACPIGGFDGKMASIKKNFPFLCNEYGVSKYVIFTHNKGLANIDVLFDDGIHNLEDVKKDSNAIPIMVNAAHNLDLISKDYFRVAGAESIKEALLSIDDFFKTTFNEEKCTTEEFFENNHIAVFKKCFIEMRKMFPINTFMLFNEKHNFSKIGGWYEC